LLLMWLMIWGRILRSRVAIGAVHRIIHRNHGGTVCVHCKNPDQRMTIVWLIFDTGQVTIVSIPTSQSLEATVLPWSMY
jgi:hypothetical protein